MGTNVQWKWQAIIEMLENKPRTKSDFESLKTPI